MTCPRAIIFDFDGVLFNTEEAIFNSWQILYEREGCALSREEYAPCLGAGYSRWDPASHLEEITGKKFDWQTENISRQAAIEAQLSTMDLMPGAFDLLHWCQAQGIRMVVASSSSRRWVDGWLRHLHAASFFERLFCRTDGFPVKPDPALFLAAINYLVLPTHACIVVEDSENGVLAASNAHIPCYAVPNTMTAHGDFSSAAAQFTSLVQLHATLRCMRGA